jgi:hypothetical protein
MNVSGKSIFEQILTSAIKPLLPGYCRAFHERVPACFCDHYSNDSEELTGIS